MITARPLAPHDQHWLARLTQELTSVRIAHRAAILQGRPWLVTELGQREANLTDDIARLLGRWPR